MSAARSDRHTPYRVYDVDDFLGEALGSEPSRPPEQATSRDFEPSAPNASELPGLSARRGRRLVPWLMAGAVAAVVATVELSSSLAPPASRDGARQMTGGQGAVSSPASARPASPDRRHRRRLRHPMTRRARGPALVVPPGAPPVFVHRPAASVSVQSSSSREFGFER